MEAVLPERTGRSNPRGVKRKMSPYLLRTRSMMRDEAVKKHQSVIVIISK